ncbi:MAG: ECF transporter S component [Clostridiales bacterium]|nr:ECF transporter S component [Clostridiales bacterium]
MRKKLVSTQMMVRIALLSAISFILFRFLEIPVIGFYKIDLSGIPVLLAGFAMGPLAGILTLLIKDVLGVIGSSSGGIGEIADFFMLASLVLPVTVAYQYWRTRATVLWGLLGGTVLMIISGMLLNYYVLIPLYTSFMSVESIISIMDNALPFLKIATLKELIFYVTGPFNLLKGLVLSVLTYWIYPYVSPLLKKGRV